MQAQYEAALAYRQLGRHPIPLAGKVPLVRGWATRRDRPDPAMLRRWFLDKYPAANVGIRTGGGLIVIDIDPRNGGEVSLRKLLGRRKFPETATAITGGRDRGTHIWLSVSGPVACRVAFGGLPGIDIRGDGGQVAVDPSIHPDTGWPYSWARPLSSGVAPCPAWLYRLLTDSEARPASPRKLPEIARSGIPSELAADLIARFPVPGFHRRNDLMVKAVGRMLGRNYDDDTTIAAVHGWWCHYFDAGKIGTNPARSGPLIRDTIRVLRGSDRFGPSINPSGHREACRSIVLTDRQISMFGAVIEDPRAGPEDSILRLSPPIRRRLCETDAERAFVEALVVMATYKLRAEPGLLVRFTNAQVVEIVSDRHPDIDLSHVQTFERLKCRYVARPGKPATRLELLAEVAKGDRKPGQVAGVPSSYRPTGIMGFLDA